MSRHSSISASHLVPSKPGVHSQMIHPSTISHTPLFKQGALAQLSSVVGGFDGADAGTAVTCDAGLLLGVVDGVAVGSLRGARDTCCSGECDGTGCGMWLGSALGASLGLSTGDTLGHDAGM